MLEQLGDRVQVAVGVGQARLDAEASGPEDALLEDLGGRVGAGLVLGGVAREAVRERGQRGGVLERGLHVERAHLDRAEPRVGRSFHQNQV